ncbi:MAG: adenylosuccinate synthase [Bacteroidetes bacterium]|nr:MAG: adenylosuccinate synthase [Bacteroidota bacterium]
MKVDVILGLQWGDEGKGKIVDVFTPHYDIIARFQGGPNAGHTIEFDGKKFVLHTIPSGIFHRSTLNLIGNGVIVDPFIFMREIDKLAEAGIHAEENLLISNRAHLILPTHRMLDTVLESMKGQSKIGSTLKGIGPTYTDKFARNGLRIGNLNENDFMERYRALKKMHLHTIRSYNADLAGYTLDGLSFEEYEKRWFEAIDRMKSFRIVEGEQFLNKSLDEGKSVMAEGAQGTLLDVDFGSYPFVTSSNTIAAGACTGLGISPHRIGRIYGIFKAYCTRVGSGPFPTELMDETGAILRCNGNEFGSTTGRPRRCGWLDLPALKYAIMLNGVDTLIMMKADVLNTFEKIKVCSNYKIGGEVRDEFPFELSDDTLEPVYQELNGWNVPLNSIQSFDMLPDQLSEYIRFIEKETGIPVEMVSIGPDRVQTLKK